MKQFRYGVDKLIEGVKLRPALWDKTTEVYKDREERRQAWEQIFRLLDDDYEKMSPEDKKATADTITTKWVNMRDTFTKSIRVQSSKGGSRKYLYYEEMAFLLKVMPPSVMQGFTEFEDDPISCNMSFKLESSAVNESEGESSMVPREMKRSRKSEREYKTPEPEPEPRHRKRSKKSEIRQPEEESHAMDFVEIGDQDPRIMNEDEAFFASLLPTVVKYSEEERLEFRIEVLAVMKSINEKRKLKLNYESDD